MPVEKKREKAPWGCPGNDRAAKRGTAAREFGSGTDQRKSGTDPGVPELALGIVRNKGPIGAPLGSVGFRAGGHRPGRCPFRKVVDRS